jgi:hypothetical protein
MMICPWICTQGTQRNWQAVGLMSCCSCTGPVGAANTADPAQEHTLYVMLLSGDPNLDIVQPAVEGTKTVLQAAAKQKANGLQRIVVTSSVCGELASQHVWPGVFLTMLYICLNAKAGQIVLSSASPDCRSAVCRGGTCLEGGGVCCLCQLQPAPCFLVWHPPSSICPSLALTKRQQSQGRMPHDAS